EELLPRIEALPPRDRAGAAAPAACSATATFPQKENEEGFVSSIESSDRPSNADDSAPSTAIEPTAEHARRFLDSFVGRWSMEAPAAGRDAAGTATQRVGSAEYEWSVGGKWLTFRSQQ